MKRLLLASICLAFFLPAVAAASSVTSDHARQYTKDYDAVRAQFGSTEAGCRLIAEGGHRSTCHQRADDGAVTASIAVLERDLAPPSPMSQAGDSGSAGSAAVPATSSTTVSQTGDSGATSGSYSDVPGVPAGFAACVAQRESTNGAGSSNIYGITAGSGYGDGGSMSLAEQKATFARIYADHGTSAWSPYDGC